MLFRKHILAIISDHIDELRKIGFVPANWHWNRDTIAALDTVSLKLLHDVTALNKRYMHSTLSDHLIPILKKTHNDLSRLMSSSNTRGQDETIRHINRFISEIDAIQIIIPKAKTAKQRLLDLYKNKIIHEPALVIARKDNTIDASFESMFIYLDEAFERADESDIIGNVRCMKGISFAYFIEGIKHDRLVLSPQDGRYANAVLLNRHNMQECWVHSSSKGQNFLFVIFFDHESLINDSSKKKIEYGYPKEHIQAIAQLSPQMTREFLSHNAAIVDGYLTLDAVRFIGFRYPVKDEDYRDDEDIPFNIRYYRID